MMKKIFSVMMLVLSFNATPHIFGLQEPSEPVKKTVTSDTLSTWEKVKPAAAPAIAVVGGGVIGGVVGAGISCIKHGRQALSSEWITGSGIIGILVSLVGLTVLNAWESANQEGFPSDQLEKRVDELEKPAKK